MSPSAALSSAVRLVGLLLFAVLLLQRGTKDIAERRTGIGRAVLGDRFLLLRDLECLDRDIHAAAFLVDLGDTRIDFLADGKAFGTLLAAIAAEIRALDEGFDAAVDQPHLDAAFLDIDHFARDDRILAQFTRR